jgi:uncharacterized protein YktB (UPF0637 family)
VGRDVHLFLCAKHQQLRAAQAPDIVWQKIFKKKFGYMWKVYYICGIKSKMLIT